MTLRKQNTKKTSISTKAKLSRASKALFSKPAKARPVHTQYVTPTVDKPKVEEDKDIDIYSMPKDVAEQIDNVARRMTVSSVAIEDKKQDKKPAAHVDIISPSAPASPASSHPVSNDNQPLIRKRTMMSQPPSSMEASSALQSAEDPKPKEDVGPQLDAPSSASLLNKLSSRPAKPLMTKPTQEKTIAPGPTVAELLDIKQKAATEAASVTTPKPQPKPTIVNDIVAPPKTPLLVKAAEATTVPASTAVLATDKEPISPKPQLVTSIRPKTDEAADVKTVSEASSHDDEDDIKPEELVSKDDVEKVETEEAAKPADNKPEDKKPADSDDKHVDDVAKSLSDTDSDKDKASSGADDIGSLQKDLGAEKPEPTPPPKAELYGGRPVIIIHEEHPILDFLRGLLVFVLGLVVIAAAVNFLLDAGIIETGYKIPHTNFLDPK